MSDKDEKEEGFARKHLNPARDVKNVLDASRKQAQQDMEYTKSAGNEFVRRLKNMFVVKKQKARPEDLEDFESLLQFWGIKEGNLPKVKKNMRVSIYAVLFMMVVASLGLIQATGLYFYCLLSALILCGLMRIVMVFWQLWVLNRRQYVSFKDWITLNF